MLGEKGAARLAFKYGSHFTVSGVGSEILGKRPREVNLDVDPAVL